MAKSFQLDKNDRINDYDINRVSVSSNNGHADYDIVVKRIANDVASYQLFYRDVYHTGYKSSLVYMLTNINDSIDEVYLTDIHTKELKIVVKQNKGLKIAHSIIDKGFIRDVFYWKVLGYRVVEFDVDNLKVENLLKKIRHEIEQKYGISSEEFIAYFDNPTFDFASKCKDVMEHIIVPAPIIDKMLNQSLKGLQAYYVCVKEL